eukprot:330448-Amphidinium_carterae.2
MIFSICKLGEHRTVLQEMTGNVHQVEPHSRSYCESRRGEDLSASLERCRRLSEVRLHFSFGAAGLRVQATQVVVFLYDQEGLITTEQSGRPSCMTCLANLS